MRATDLGVGVASGSMEAADEGAPRANLCPVREGVRAAVEHKTHPSTLAVERKPVVMSVLLAQPPGEDDARLACAAARLARQWGEVGRTKMRWIADTGSANHLMGREQLGPQQVNKLKTVEELRLATANGVITTDKAVDVWLPDLQITARLIILDHCPSVLSIGRLVEDEMLEFHWVPGRAWFVEANGTEYDCAVENYVPVLNAKAGERSGCALTAACITENSASPEELQGEVMVFNGNGGITQPALPGSLQEVEQQDDGGQGEGGQPAAAEPVPPVVQHEGGQGEGGQLAAAEPPPPPEAPMSAEMRLRLGARSKSHFLTHLPKNPYCRYCLEGKTFQKPARRRAPVIYEVPVGWGKTLLGDHFFPGKHGMAVDGQKVGLMLKDLGAKFKGVFGLPNKGKVPRSWPSANSAGKLGGRTSRRTTAASSSPRLRQS